MPSGRMVNDGPIRLIARQAPKPGGEFRFGTDHAVYLRHCADGDAAPHRPVRNGSSRNPPIGRCARQAGPKHAMNTKAPHGLRPRGVVFPVPAALVGPCASATTGNSAKHHLSRQPEQRVRLPQPGEPLHRGPAPARTTASKHSEASSSAKAIAPICQRLSAPPAIPEAHGSAGPPPPPALPPASPAVSSAVAGSNPDQRRQPQDPHRAEHEAELRTPSPNRQLQQDPASSPFSPYPSWPWQAAVSIPPHVPRALSDIVRHRHPRTRNDNPPDHW